MDFRDISVKKVETVEAFLAFVSAGLWETIPVHDGGLMVNDSTIMNWKEVYRLATEQSVLGLILAGIETSNVKPPQEVLLQWIGEVQMIEQQNKAMNEFVAQLNKLFWQNNIYGLLVKGQGVAQCYERPLWRISGDIDIMLDEDNYEKAKVLLIPLAEEVQIEDIRKKHQAVIIKGFDVELHGKMPFGLSRKADKVIDVVIEDSLKHGGARVWTNNTDIYLPNADNDVILVFTHFLRHFFIEGVGLRQICDWCRLLFTYKDSLNYELLESRIRKMGLMSEWKAFGALAIEYLGFPKDSMPLLNVDVNANLKKKADRILELVLESGNFGHNKDLSYRVKYKGFTYKLVSLWRRLCDFWRFATIFPLDAPRFFVTYVTGKVK